MSDVTVFCMGFFVSMVVTAATGLLLWGAANEPKGRLLPLRDKSAEPTARRDRDDRLVG